MQGELERYNDIIQNQLSQGTVEGADEVVKDERDDTFLKTRSCVRMQNLQKCALSMMLLEEHMQVSPHATSVSKSALHYRTSFGTCRYEIGSIPW